MGLAFSLAWDNGPCHDLETCSGSYPLLFNTCFILFHIIRRIGHRRWRCDLWRWSQSVRHLERNGHRRPGKSGRAGCWEHFTSLQDSIQFMDILREVPGYCVFPISLFRYHCSLGCCRLTFLVSLLFVALVLAILWDRMRKVSTPQHIQPSGSDELVRSCKHSMFNGPLWLHAGTSCNHRTDPAPPASGDL